MDAAVKEVPSVPQRICAGCGYNLAGLSGDAGACPECGDPVAQGDWRRIAADALGTAGWSLMAGSVVGLIVISATTGMSGRAPWVVDESLRVLANCFFLAPLAGVTVGAASAAVAAGVPRLGRWTVRAAVAVGVLLVVQAIISNDVTRGFAYQWLWSGLAQQSTRRPALWLGGVLGLGACAWLFLVAETLGLVAARAGWRRRARKARLVGRVGCGVMLAGALAQSLGLILTSYIIPGPPAPRGGISIQRLYGVLAEVLQVLLPVLGAAFLACESALALLLRHRLMFWSGKQAQ